MQLGGDHGKLYHAVYIHLRAYLLKGDDAGGQTCARIGVNVPPVEGIAFAGTRQTVDGFVNHPRLGNADHPFDVGQGAVVGSDHVLPAGGANHDAAAGAAHAGIHHADKYAALGPVRHRLDQAVAGFPDVILGNIMGQVVDAQLIADAFRHAVHGGNCAVRVTKVALKDQRPHKTPPKIIR